MAKDKNGRELPKGITWRKDKDIYMIRFTYQGTPYTFYEKSLSEAKKTLKDKRYEVEHGLAGKANRITLNQWFETWFTTYKLKTVKESTAETYFKVYNNHIRETIGSKRLDQIKSVHIQKLYNELSEQNLSATYISNIGAVLHNIFDIAVKNDLLPKNPCIGAIKPKAEQKEPRCLSMKEQETLLSYLKQDKWKQHEPLITFLLNTGMRIGEALGLKWDDVDFEKHEIRIERTIFYRKNTEMHKERYVFQTPKTEKSRRTIILPQNAEKALHRQKLYQNQMKLYNGSNWKPLDGFDGLVFTTEKGTPILSNCCGQAFL